MSSETLWGETTPTTPIAPDSGSARDTPQARLVDGALVVSLPDADTPSLWRLTTDQLDGAALVVRSDGDGHGLGLERRDGQFEPLARYRRHGDAQRALAVTAAALMQTPAAAAGDNPVRARTVAQPGRSLPVWGWAVLGLGGLAGLAWALSATAPDAPVASETPAADTAAPSLGVPVPADDFFRNR